MQNTFNNRIKAGTRISTGFAIIVLLSSCATSKVVAPYAIVREAQFRTEKVASDRIALPLTEDGRTRILRYLKAGGNTQMYGKGISDLNAEQHYAPLLGILSHPLTLDDLSRGEVKKAFKVGPIYQVIDSRERFALSDTQVAAMYDGKYWWVFYHPASKRLEQLLLSRAVGTKPTD
jgi:hypothetical protein